MMRGLLLDRDGVINIDRGYVCDKKEISFVDGVFSLAIRAIDCGYRIAVITNQSGIARGYYLESQFLELSRWMAAEFERHGAPLAGIFHCPYHAKGTDVRYARESFWRKPNPGMILEAQRELSLDLTRSVFVGDQPSDMEAACAAGVGRAVLLAHEYKPVTITKANCVITSLFEAEALL